MAETVNQENNTTTPEEQKTFTQDELNAIVGERLKRESDKYADYEDLKAKAQKFDEYTESQKTELEKANEKTASLEAELTSLKKANEVREMREKVAKEKGVPVDLLTGDTEEECAAFADKLNAYKKPGTYPNVKDGGEVKGNSGKTTRDQFADWFGSLN